MPKTAYSKKFKRELDPEQLLALFKYDMSFDPDLKNLPVELRDEIYRDLVCQECGVNGCVIVSRAKSKKTNSALRQPHFRFLAVEGTSAHHPLCDNYDNSELKTNHGEQLVDFGQDRTNETKVIRELVTKGMEQQIFSQQTIRDMRQWFFDTKIKHQFTMDLSKEALQWVDKLRRLFHHPGISFNPVHAELPGFDWQHAAIRQFVLENAHLFTLIRSLSWGYDKTSDQRALRFVQKFQQQKVFDVSVLESQYKKTVELGFFAARNLRLYEGDLYRRGQIYNTGVVPATLMVFAALLLYVSDWDVNEAISKLVMIVHAPHPIDMNAGNVIGLNPFHDFTVWSNILNARKICDISKYGFDYDSQILTIEQRLRDQYAEWIPTQREDR